MFGFEIFVMVLNTNKKIVTLVSMYYLKKFARLTYPYYLRLKSSVEALPTLTNLYSWAICCKDIEEPEVEKSKEENGFLGLRKPWAPRRQMEKTER